MQTMTFKPHNLTAEEKTTLRAVFSLKPAELSELKALASK